MRLIFGVRVRRFVGLAFLLFFTVPFGLSVIGCGHKTATVQYCNGGDSGPVVGQLSSVELSPALAIQGISLNYGQIGSGLSLTGYDCKGSVVTTSGVIYATTDMTYADINPANGQLCGGSWNRHTTGGIPDYTLCTAPASQTTTEHLSYVTATADGITSNAVPVYVHGTVTSIVFGQTTSACGKDSSGNFLDPDSTCCPADANTVITGTAVYDGVSCISQNSVKQVAARVYINNLTDAADNITCKAGHLSFGASNSAIVTLDQNGVATAQQPGSTTITAALSNSTSASSIGFFSTCPPTSIAITPTGQSGATSISVPLYNSQPFTITAKDAYQATLTGLSLTFPSSNPQIVPLNAGTAVPAFPGSATITAICQPPTCNPSPTDQLGLNGNGKPVTSNGVTITSPGTSATQIYVGSTSSRYILPVDYSTGLPGTLIKLPYAPNSMAITVDGSTVYFGSTYGIMSMPTSTNVPSANNTLIPGTIVGISPTDGTLVVTDATRQTTSLVTGGATVAATYGGIATHAAWSADGTTVYITTSTNSTDTNAGYILNHSTNSNWQKTPIAGTTASGNPAKTSLDTYYTDVSTLANSVGVYFAGAKSTDGRSYCATSTLGTNTTDGAPVVTNVFTPLADVEPVITDRITTTTDTTHVLGANSTATAGGTPYLSDIKITSATGVCDANTNNTTRVEPAINFTSTASKFNFAGVVPSAITGVVAANNSAVAFVTFTGTGNGLVPYYLPGTSALKYLTLNTTYGTPTAPVAGVFSSDNYTFYLGTAGDNAVHLITLTYPTSGAPTAVDSAAPINPQLPVDPLAVPGGTGIATPNLIVQRPKKVTS